MIHHDEPSRAALQFGDDLRVGTHYDLGAYTLTEQDSVAFARAWDPQVFHVDKAAAEAGVYGGLIASGVQTLGIYQRLAVLAVFRHWSVIAGIRMREVRFLRPVRPGDTLAGAMTLDAAVPAAEGRTLVTTTSVLTNQAGKRVLQVTLDAYVHARPESA